MVKSIGMSLLEPAPNSGRHNSAAGSGLVAFCNIGNLCCAVIGLTVLCLVIFNTITTVRLQDEVRELRDQLDMDNYDILLLTDWIRSVVELDDEPNEAEDIELPPNRSIRSLDQSANGIPVVDESYAVSRQRTNSPADDAIEDLLLNKPATTRPTMVYDWTRRQKRYHAPSEHHQNNIDNLDSGHIQTQAGSRVMSTKTADRSKAFRQIMTKSEYEQWQSQRTHRLHNQHNHHSRTADNGGGLMTKSLETNHWPTQVVVHHRVRTIIAVHYGATQRRDASRAPQVRNIDWQASKWVNKLAMDRFFQMQGGTVVVRKSGLYQVYAQITFEKRSSPNGFIVVHNAERFLECQTSTQSSNSCYTSRVVYMESGDQIRLGDMFANQRVVLHEGQSFFGLMKLGQVQDRSNEIQQP